MKVIIAGARDFWGYGFVKSSVESLDLNASEVVSGCAFGVDSIGLWWAAHRGLPVKLFPADWNTHGKKAGPIRNAQMADYADVLIAFPSKDSIGTRDMIRKMKQRKKQVYVFEV